MNFTILSQIIVAVGKRDMTRKSDNYYAKVKKGNAN